MPVVVRPLSDADLPAVEALLAPTEERSLFLLGNARNHGITDRGGARNGAWFGAFADGRLAGVLAATRAGTLLPACGPYAEELVAAISDAAPVTPSLVVGAVDRVGNVVAVLPPSRIQTVRRETLLVMRWPDWRPPPHRVATCIANAARIDEVVALLTVLSTEGGVPQSADVLRARAERLVAEGLVRVAIVGGRAVALSATAATSPRFVQVGGTATDPAHRRRGLAGSCVADVIESARAAGHASEGAVLFTAAENHEALALYHAMGFRDECEWSIALLQAHG
jgi:ribosomal protein S18 acetylase RimI-like enzyme